MPGLSIQMLGTLAVDQGTNAEPPLGANGRALLCYLLLHRDRPISRTTIADLLWPGGDAAHALKYLRQALWQLQHCLGHANDCEGDPLLDVNARFVTLRSQAIASLDVETFEHALEHTRTSASHPFTASDAAEADAAVSLYRGDLLEGFDFEWCIVEREFLRSGYLTLLDRLMIHSERTGEYALGIEYGERILRVDRAREYSHRRMMYLHALLGNRTGALRQFQRCVSALDEELDVAPAKSTVMLHQLIRSGAELPARTPHHVDDFAQPSSERDAPPAERLRGIQRALNELQRQIQAEFGIAEW